MNDRLISCPARNTKTLLDLEDLIGDGCAAVVATKGPMIVTWDLHCRLDMWAARGDRYEHFQAHVAERPHLTIHAAILTARRWFVALDNEAR